MSQDRYDVLVIGGGPGGYVGAIRAAQLGLRTALVERAALGGICLNWGCIPTKALLHSAAVLRTCRAAAEAGVSIEGSIEPKLDAMVARSRAIAGHLGRGVAHLLKKHGVTVIQGRARLLGEGRVQVQDGPRMQAQHIVLATGARARALPELPPGERVWTYREALAPSSLPASLLVVGAGAIGMEFACFYRALGSDVTVVEAAPRILPQEDAEIAAVARKAFEAQGIRIHTGCKVASSRVGALGVHVAFTGDTAPAALQVERAISAAGIVGNVEDLGLEHTRVEVRGTHIVTDGLGRTAQPGVYAIGDVAGAPWLAHKASHEAVRCMEAIAGLPAHAPDPRRIPACTYTFPQVASLGLTEARAREWAREQGRELRIGRFPFAANGRALAAGEGSGLVKTIFDAVSGELLGSHVVHAEASELIAAHGVAMGLEATEADLMESVFAHPTLGEALHEAVLAAQGAALHV
ncbi:2-oxoglutarate dehydrogenase complex%2C E3 component [Bordetella ansorpii]|uniref:Dihydrolipoyl dehydrogenase n=1 Tax=Bordetella ansorpii TaxID=288768 RepID=A0A157LDL2_9BORD|nr:dihydrolipoyl dehydrogenase [Bordetella ansorpii]SAH94664.1 2-oxoglutarate dehydrogenase complex%2C E3 component [Bordetella ansorpii]